MFAGNQKSWFWNPKLTFLLQFSLQYFTWQFNGSVFDTMMDSSEQVLNNGNRAGLAQWGVFRTRKSTLISDVIFLFTTKLILYPSITFRQVHTARSWEDDIWNGHRNADRNPRWWWDFSQLVKIEKLKFLGILRHKFEVRFCFNVTSSVSRCTNLNRDFGVI